MAARKELQTQKDIAFKHLESLVDAVLGFVISDAVEVGKIFNELAMWGDDGDERFLNLTEKLSRHIFLNYPQLVKSESLFKALFLSSDEDIKGVL